jgi:hypothetical protein
VKYGHKVNFSAETIRQLTGEKAFPTRKSYASGLGFRVFSQAILLLKGQQRNMA